MSIPDGIQPHIGFRAWSVVEAPGILTPVLAAVYRRSIVWSRREPMEAEHLTTVSLRTLPHLRKGWNVPRVTEGEREKPHRSPSAKCSCGLWGCWTESEARMQMTNVGTTIIFGVVAGWGHVVKGPKGFRAQYARPIALFADERNLAAELMGGYRTLGEGELEALGEAYGAPVVKPGEFKLEWTA